MSLQLTLVLTKRRAVMPEWGQLSGIDYCSIPTPFCRFDNIHIALVIAIAMKYGLERWSLDRSTALLNTNVVGGVYAEMAPRLGRYCTTNEQSYDYP